MIRYSVVPSAGANPLRPGGDVHQPDGVRAAQHHPRPGGGQPLPCRGLRQHRGVLPPAPAQQHNLRIITLQISNLNLNTPETTKTYYCVALCALREHFWGEYS